MVSKLDGPRLMPQGRAPRQLVVFLHGYGADGNDLIVIGQQWRTLLPDALFVAPHAPQICVASVGRQWFALDLRSEEELSRGVNQAAPSLDAFLDAELARHRLSPERLALVGFSQGAMLALHMGLRRRTAGVVSYSGVLVGARHLTKANAPRSPILLVHGNQDDLIPVEALFVSAEELAKAGVACQWHLSVGIGHGIDAGGLMHGGMFLAQCFAAKPPAGLTSGVR